jgi:hypothetical protein
MPTSAATKQGYRPDEAADYMGSKQLFAEMVAAKWIAPVVSRTKIVLYDAGDLAKCWARIRSGEEPPRIPRK